jgi:ribosomal protein S18 acetylase RimI-like enzyme
MLTFKAMSEQEYLEFRKLSMNNYKDDKIRANGLTNEEAQKIAEADFNRYLIDGFHTKDNFLFVLVDEFQHSIGHLWYVVRGAEDNKKAFIADIFLHSDYRGKGYGRQAMELLESHVKDQGLSAIGLHVFGFNEAAIGLYKKLGYQTTDLVMEKSV